MNWFLPHTGAEARKSAEVDRTARTRLSLESLEDRTTPTVVFNPVFGPEQFHNDRHGELSSPNLALVFWGDFWGGPSTFKTQPYQDAAQRVLDSGYLGLLAQYGSDGHAKIDFAWNNQHVSSVWVPGSFPGNKFHGLFNPTDAIYSVAGTALFNTYPAAKVSPANTIYVVITPPGVGDGNSGENGFNSASTAWVGIDTGNAGLKPGQLVDSFSTTFGHEVAEAISDPTPFFGAFHTGITFGPAPLFVQNLGNQIGDNEGEFSGGYNYRQANGALVQALWSDNAIQGEIRTIQKWVATDGNKQAVTLDPIWDIPNPPGFPTGSSAGASFHDQFDLTIDGDQFGPANDQPGNDDIILDTTSNGGVLVWLNGEQFQFDPGQIRNLTVNPELGQNHVAIRSMAAGVNYTVNTTTSLGVKDTLDVMPGSQNLDGVVAPLTIHGALPGYSGQTIVNLHDELHPGGIDYELKDGAGPNSGVLTRATNDTNHFLRGTPIRFDNLTTLNVYSAVLFNDAFTIDDTPCTTHLEGSIKGCTVDVQGTTLPLSYKGFSNNDWVHVGHGTYSPNPTVDHYTLDTLHGNVTVSGAFGNYTLGLTVDDGGDTSQQNVLLTDIGVSFGGGVQIGGTDLRDFNLILGSAAGSLVNVAATPNTGPVGSTTTHIDSYAASLTVNVDGGGIGSVQGVRGRLSIDQGIASVLTGRRVDLTIDDSIDTVGRNAVISRGQIAGLAPAAIRFDESHLNSFTVRGGKGGNRFTVADTPDNGLGMPTNLSGGTSTDVFTVNGTSGPLQVNGGGGVDFVTVGGFGTLNFLAAPVDAANPTGQTVLNIDDHLSTVGRFGTLGTSSLTFLTAVNAPPAPITWSKANVVSLHVAGGSGGNTFAVNAFVNLPLFTTLNSGAGNDTVRIAGGTGSFYLDGDGGTDLVTVGNGSLTGINGTVYLANAHGHSFVTADDSKSIIDRNYRLLPSPLNLPYPGSLTLTGTNTAVRFNPGEVQAFTVKAGSGFDMMGVLGLDNRVALGFDGGSGKDTVLGPSGDHIWAVTAANGGSIDNLFTFTNTENLIGQTGMDVFKFAPGGSVSGTISGGGGGDWLDYSAVAQGVFVDLPTGKASLVNGGKVGGVSQIRNARGSDVGNLFTGDGQGNIFVGGAGSDLLVGGSGRNVLIGGGGADVIRGGSAGDLLIAGRTSYDDDNAALDAIQAEWLSADTYAQRIAKLKTGVGPGNAVKLQFGVTVFADPVPNLLVGGAGQDWFFASPLDVIPNQQAGEAVN